MALGRLCLLSGYTWLDICMCACQCVNAHSTVNGLLNVFILVLCQLLVVWLSKGSVSLVSVLTF